MNCIKGDIIDCDIHVYTIESIIKYTKICNILTILQGGLGVIISGAGINNFFMTLKDDVSYTIMILLLFAFMKFLFYLSKKILKTKE